MHDHTLCFYKEDSENNVVDLTIYNVTIIIPINHSPINFN